MIPNIQQANIQFTDKMIFEVDGPRCREKLHVGRNVLHEDVVVECFLDDFSHINHRSYIFRTSGIIEVRWWGDGEFCITTITD